MGFFCYLSIIPPESELRTQWLDGHSNLDIVTTQQTEILEAKNLEKEKNRTSGYIT